MIFLTVGTQFPFDRLVRAVDEALSRNGAHDVIFGQIGDSEYNPQNFEAVKYLDKNRFDAYFRDASAVISHAGVGTILMALEHHKPLLVMPRLEKYGEVVNDHQVTTARQFEQSGFLIAAYGERQLADRIKMLESFVPRAWTSEPGAVVRRIAEFMRDVRKTKDSCERGAR